MRPIDADALREDFLNDYNNYVMEGLRGNFHDMIRITDVIERINDEPTLEYAPVKHGHWEKEEDFIGKKYRCTMCKEVIRYDRAYVCQGELIFDFCPFCGADMRGEENDKS